MGGRFPTGLEQEDRPWTGHKGVSTNNRKRVLPSSGSSDWPGEEVRGQARGGGVQTEQAFVLRQAWSVDMQPRGRRRAVDGRPLYFG